MKKSSPESVCMHPSGRGDSAIRCHYLSQPCPEIRQKMSPKAVCPPFDLSPGRSLPSSKTESPKRNWLPRKKRKDGLEILRNLATLLEPVSYMSRILMMTTMMRSSQIQSSNQGTTCPEGMVSFPKSLPVLPSVTLIPTSWTKRRLLSFPRAGRYSGSLPKRPYSSCLRSILSEGSPYMFSPIHCSLLPSFVLFSSIVTS